MKDFCAVIPAAGSGSRMGMSEKKQFIKLAGKPVLYYCIKSFLDVGIDEVILVVPKEDMDFTNEMVRKYSFSGIKVVQGEDSRGESVYAGLLAAEKKYSMIHDGSRPFIDTEIIKRCADCVMRHGSAVAAMPSKDTIKMADKEGLVGSTPDRSKMYIIQTPQVFPTELIKNAYSRVISDGTYRVFTDDAGVMESLGYQVYLTRGSYSNFKITERSDLMLAEALLLVSKNNLNGRD